MGTRFDTKNQIEPLNTSEGILLNTSDSSDGIVLNIFEFRIYSQGYPGNLVCSVTFSCQDQATQSGEPVPVWPEAPDLDPELLGAKFGDLGLGGGGACML